MFEWINQHSFLFGVLSIAALAVIATSGVKRIWLRGTVLGGIGIVVVVAYLMLSSGPSTHATRAEVNLAFASGAPLLVEFYSDY